MFVPKKCRIFVTVKGKGDGKGKAPGLHLSTLSGATKKILSMAKVVKISEVFGKLEKRNELSKWKRGVNEIARYILSNAMDNGFDEVELANLREVLLNGAKDFAQYAEGGQLLIYDGDIAKCLCTPSELRRCTAKDGTLQDPNRYSTWMDVQAWAATQAWQLIRDCAASCAETVYAVRGGFVEYHYK